MFLWKLLKIHSFEGRLEVFKVVKSFIYNVFEHFSYPTYEGESGDSVSTFTAYYHMRYINMDNVGFIMY